MFEVALPFKLNQQQNKHPRACVLARQTLNHPSTCVSGLVCDLYFEIGSQLFAPADLDLIA